MIVRLVGTESLAVNSEHNNNSNERVCGLRYGAVRGLRKRKSPQHFKGTLW